MKIAFTKYHGTGNDFIIIDDRLNEFDHNNTQLIAKLCHRRFGIGADGLMLVRNHSQYDFEMIYFNADGAQSSMCGNGGRCIAHFAYSIGIGLNNELTFMAIDGLHNAKVLDENRIALGMINVDKIDIRDSKTYILNTGSPHYVRIFDETIEGDIVEKAKSIRYNSEFKTEGININFIHISSNSTQIRTYERGVEDETYSCGTGAVAAAITSFLSTSKVENCDNTTINLNTLGGNLSVSFSYNNNQFSTILLTGPASKVFEGSINLAEFD